MKFNLRQKSLDDFNPPDRHTERSGGICFMLQRGTKKRRVMVSQ